MMSMLSLAGFHEPTHQKDNKIDMEGILWENGFH